MSTTLVKPAEVERKWYLLDAAGKSLGHVAAEAAVLLRGKQKVDYTPNVDCGDFVVVINCDKAVLTGKKAEQKFHITHSKFIGGLKKVQYSKLMAENSDLAMTYAVKGSGFAILVHISLHSGQLRSSSHPQRRSQQRSNRQCRLRKQSEQSQRRSSSFRKAWWRSTRQQESCPQRSEHYQP